MLSHARDTEKARDQTICIFCDRKYSTISNCRRHMVVCGENEQNASKVVSDASKVVSDASKVVSDASKVVSDAPKVVMDESKNSKQFSCPTCYKSFTRLSILQEHTPHCKCVSSVLECSTCHKMLSSKSSLYVHRKSCCVPSEQKTISQTINIHIDNFHHNGIVTNNVNIQLNDFGKERLDHIDPAFIEKCLKSLSGDGIPNMVKKIYCDPNVPENHNVKICNENKEFMSVREDNEWTFKDKHDTLDKVILNAWRPVYEHYIGEDCELRKLYEKEQYKGLQNRLLDICHQKRDVKYPLRRKVFPVFVNNDSNTIDNEEL